MHGIRYGDTGGDQGYYPEARVQYSGITLSSLNQNEFGAIDSKWTAIDSSGKDSIYLSLTRLGIDLRDGVGWGWEYGASEPFA